MDDALHDELAIMGVRHWWYRARRVVVRAVLEVHLPARADRRLLEVGAGTGSVTMLLTEFGTVTAVEPHPVALESCARIAPDAQLLRGDIGDLAHLVGDVEPRFDVVAAFDVIEHVEDDIAALRALQPMLAPGGRLVLTVPALEMLWGPHDDVNGHYRRYSRALLVRNLRRAGYEVEYVSYFSTVLFPIVAAVRVGRRLLGLHPEELRSDFRLPPQPLNQALTRLFSLEGAWLARRPLPIGSSLIAVARAR